jgi:hypothetical protein
MNMCGVALKTLYFLLNNLSFIPGEYQRLFTLTSTYYQECLSKNGNIYLIQVILVAPKILLFEILTEERKTLRKYFCRLLCCFTGHWKMLSPRSSSSTRVNSPEEIIFLVVATTALWFENIFLPPVLIFLLHRWTAWENRVSMCPVIGNSSINSPNFCSL